MLGKKPDAVMIYATATESESAVCLIPKDYCGMVPLINTASQEGEKNNCRSVKLVVEGALRILIMASDTIEIG